MTPPVWAMPRSCASPRLRLLSQVAFTPVWETITGRVAMASTSSMVRGAACARSTSMWRASMRRTILRPLSVSPVLSTPAEEPPISLSKKCVGAINAEEAGGDGGIGAAPVEVGAQPGGGPDDGELALRAGFEIPQARCLVQGALSEAAPGGGRPAFDDGEQRKVVGIGGVALEVQAARRFGDHGERLQRHVAFDQARDIDMPTRAAHQQVARPEQAIGVQIHDGDAALKIAGTRRDLVRRLVQHAVHGAFDVTGEPDECAGKRGDNGYDPVVGFAHGEVWAIERWLSSDGTGVEARCQIEAAADRADRGRLAIQTGELAQAVDGFDAGAVRAQQVL